MRARHCLCFPLLCAVACLACAAEQEDVLRRDPIHGTMNAVPWTGGPASVRKDPSRGVVIRVYEQGAGQDACALEVYYGRRIELQFPKLQAGTFDAGRDAGFEVSGWDGTQGWRDPQGRAEVDQTPSKKGDAVTARVRFGSSLNGDVIEGQFSATLCEDL